MKLKQHKRWNASRKAEVAIILLKGEPLEEVSRLTGQPAYVLKEWKENFLQGGQATFQTGESAKEKALEAENRSLKAKGSLHVDHTKPDNVRNVILIHITDFLDDRIEGKVSLRPTMLMVLLFIS